MAAKKTTRTKKARADKQRENSAKKATSRPAGKSHHGKSQSGIKAASKPKLGGDRRESSADMIDAALRQTEALSLRQAGKTFAEIAAKLGYSDHSGARNAVLAALRENAAEPNAEMRALELARLDALQAALWLNATAGHLGAVDRVLKVMERRARILGLDAPPQKPAEGDIDDLIQQELDRISGLEEPAGHGQEATSRSTSGHAETIH
jgi:hypothetical protein